VSVREVRALRGLSAALILVSVLLGPAPRASARAGDGEPPASVSLPPELARVLTDYEDAWSRKDAPALARLFAEDGWVLQNGAPPARGRAAIERAYAGSGGPLALRAFAYATQGDVGYVIGGFARRRGDADLGKFTLTLRRVAGKWLIVSDMDNGNRPGGAG
jgi:ketosteroid isomerase-like protein